MTASAVKEWQETSASANDHALPVASSCCGCGSVSWAECDTGMVQEAADSKRHPRVQYVYRPRANLKGWSAEQKRARAAELRLQGLQHNRASQRAYARNYHANVRAAVQFARQVRAAPAGDRLQHNVDGTPAPPAL